jgi:hypothetical protein
MLASAIPPRFCCLTKYHVFRQFKVSTSLSHQELWRLLVRDSFMQVWEATRLDPINYPSYLSIFLITHGTGNSLLDAQCLLASSSLSISHRKGWSWRLLARAQIDIGKSWENTLSIISISHDRWSETTDLPRARRRPLHFT